MDSFIPLRIRRDGNLNTNLVSDKQKLPRKNALPGGVSGNTGMAGDMILNQSDNTFYGHNGLTWQSFDSNPSLVGGTGINIVGNDISINLVGGTGINIVGNDVNIDLVGGTGINIVGNVISSDGASSNTWADVLTNGNTSGGNNAIITNGDEIQGDNSINNGHLVLRGGELAGSDGGDVQILGGQGDFNVGGDLIIRSGAGTGSAKAGSILIQGGTSATSDHGKITLRTLREFDAIRFDYDGTGAAVDFATDGIAAPQSLIGDYCLRLTSTKRGFHTVVNQDEAPNVSAEINNVIAVFAAVTLTSVTIQGSDMSGVVDFDIVLEALQIGGLVTSFTCILNVFFETPYGTNVNGLSIVLSPQRTNFNAGQETVPTLFLTQSGQSGFSARMVISPNAPLVIGLPVGLNSRMHYHVINNSN